VASEIPTTTSLITVSPFFFVSLQPNKKCSKQDCSSFADRTCRGNVATVDHCGKEFCEQHVRFVQLSYQCESCESDSTGSKLQRIKDKNRIDMAKTERLQACLVS
jgi:hypothetical protein